MCMPNPAVPSPSTTGHRGPSASNGSNASRAYNDQPAIQCPGQQPDAPVSASQLPSFAQPSFETQRHMSTVQGTPHSYPNAVQNSGPTIVGHEPSHYQSSAHRSSIDAFPSPYTHQTGGVYGAIFSGVNQPSQAQGIASSAPDGNSQFRGLRFPYPDQGSSRNGSYTPGSVISPEQEAQAHNAEKAKAQALSQAMHKLQPHGLSINSSADAAQNEDQMSGMPFGPTNVGMDAPVNVFSQPPLPVSQDAVQQQLASRHDPEDLERPNLVKSLQDPELYADTHVPPKKGHDRRKTLNPAHSEDDETFTRPVVAFSPGENRVPDLFVSSCEHRWCFTCHQPGHLSDSCLSGAPKRDQNPFLRGHELEGLPALDTHTRAALGPLDCNPLLLLSHMSKIYTEVLTEYGELLLWRDPILRDTLKMIAIVERDIVDHDAMHAVQSVICRFNCVSHQIMFRLLGLIDAFRRKHIMPLANSYASSKDQPLPKHAFRWEAVLNLFLDNDLTDLPLVPQEAVHEFVESYCVIVNEFHKRNVQCRMWLDELLKRDGGISNSAYLLHLCFFAGQAQPLAGSATRETILAEGPYSISMPDRRRIHDALKDEYRRIIHETEW